VRAIDLFEPLELSPGTPAEFPLDYLAGPGRFSVAFVRGGKPVVVKTHSYVIVPVELGPDELPGMAEGLLLKAARARRGVGRELGEGERVTVADVPLVVGREPDNLVCVRQGGLFGLVVFNTNLVRCA
jgi:hypothetical protein